MIAPHRSAPAARRRHAYNYYILGQQCVDDGAVDVARQHLTRALGYDPDFVPALRVLANLEYTQHHFDVARHLLQRALTQTPDDGELQFLLGGLELGDGHPEAALAAYQRAALLGDDSPELQFNVGLAYLFTSQPQPAADTLQRLLDAHPDHQRGWDALGCARRMLRDVDGAMHAFLQALEIDPMLNDARDHLAQLMLDAGHFPHARQVLETALDVDPERVSSRHLLGVALASQHRYEEAVVCWQQIIARGAATPDTYHLLANAYLHLSRTSHAIGTLETLLTLAPHHVAGHLQLALLLLEQGEHTRARFHLEQAKTLDPQHPTVLHVLAAISDVADEESV